MNDQVEQSMVPRRLCMPTVETPVNGKTPIHKGNEQIGEETSTARITPKKLIIKQHNEINQITTKLQKLSIKQRCNSATGFVMDVMYPPSITSKWNGIFGHAIPHFWSVNCTTVRAAYGMNQSSSSCYFKNLSMDEHCVNHLGGGCHTCSCLSFLKEDRYNDLFHFIVNLHSSFKTANELIMCISKPPFTPLEILQYKWMLLLRIIGVQQLWETEFASSLDACRREVGKLKFDIFQWMRRCYPDVLVNVDMPEHSVCLSTMLKIFYISLRQWRKIRYIKDWRSEIMNLEPSSVLYAD